MSVLVQVLVFLAAIVVAVPLSKRLGLGSVLGYLAAGVAIGPAGLKLISDVDAIFHVAEFGVVLLLFLIGLELEPSRLWELRRAVFGVGGAQVVGTALVIGAIALAFGLTLKAAFVIGIGLSLSSTAFALQLLAEKNQLNTDFGRASFGILLFQDLAVIPVLAILPVLGVTPEGAAADSTWWAVAKAAGAVVAVYLVGRYLLRPVFRIVASTKSQEVFTATALLVAIGTAAGVSAAGLSMALGSFLAGVLLAESEYRHELEADIEPFKGLLLGLFFIAVGMSVKLGLVGERPLTVLALVLGFVAVKIACLFLLGRVVFRANAPALSMAVVIAEGGEFAFVLFQLGVGYQLMERSMAELLVVVVSLSMALTPPLFMAYEKWLSPRLKKSAPREFDPLPDEDSPVVVAGFGRVGQVLGRILRGKRIPFTAMDSNAEHIDFIRNFGAKVFYGDAGRLDLLRSARVDKAKVFVVAIDEIEASMRCARMVKEHFPHVKLFARARNRQHAYALLDLGVDYLMRETFESSVLLSGEVLRALGTTHHEVERAMIRFREYDEEILRRSFKFQHDLEKLQGFAKASREELEKIFEGDVNDQRRAS